MTTLAIQHAGKEFTNHKLKRLTLMKDALEREEPPQIEYVPRWPLYCQTIAAFLCMAFSAYFH